MPKDNIELLRTEAIRLLQVEISLLQRMKESEGVIVVDQSGGHQTFSPDSVDKDLAMLRGEASKLEHLDMVLAVVGTMKAGKSTTINAIVGSEVLPNRNRPMTALPTRIRHTPGQKEPLLHMENNGPLNDLLKKLNQALATPEGQDIQEEYKHEPDMAELLQFIQEHGQFSQTHNGPQAIFDFLKGLNDLVRLASALEIEFPFSSYTHIDDIPVIKVEFSHLAHLPTSIGNLTLLDTPGPNEAGQVHLRHMLREQLKNASAVLAVLDFTQLKSDADQQVRDELKRIADVAQNRMFALVNKFDEKNRNSDSAEQTRTLVAESLLQGRIDSTKVFPVSSKLGDLANRAQRELARHGRLPEPGHESTAWVEDFGNAALGAFWEDDIKDPQRVQKAANRLWEKSLFSAPLDNVIHKAHEQAAVLAISSAAAKLADIGNKLNNFLNARETALGKTNDELKAQIDSLNGDIVRIQSLEEEARESASKALEDIKKTMSAAIKETKSRIGHELDKNFNDAKEIEKQQVVQRAANEQLHGSLFGVLGAFWGSPSAKKPLRKKSRFGYEFDPQNTVIKLDSPREAEEIIKGIDKGVQDIFSEQEQRLTEASGRFIEDFQKKFDEDISKKANEVIGELNKRLKGEGFAIHLKVPHMPHLSMRGDNMNSLHNLIEDKRRWETRKRHKKGVWGTVCSWFNTDDWGTEEYQARVGSIEIDTVKIRKAIAEKVDRIFKDLDSTVQETIKKSLEEQVGDFFDEIKQTVNALRADLNQSILDKQKSQESQKTLATLLRKLKRQAPAIQQDSEALHQDVQTLLGEAA